MLETLFDWLFNPAKRTHYVYWLSSLVIICVWARFAWCQRHKHISNLAQTSYWFNRSTIQDYILMFFNRGLFWLLGIPWLIFTLDISLTVLDAWRIFGSVTQTPIEGPLVTTLYTLIVFLLDDVSRFGLHRLMHKVDFLWRIHQLHHSAATLTPFTTLRLHPLESILYSIRSSLVHGFCIGSGFYFLGYQADSWQLWGASIWVIVFNLFGANLRHSAIPLHYGRLEKWLISPSQHQAHHGVQSMRCNYGSVLSIWDRLAGTWRSGRFSYSLPKTAQPLWRQLLLKPISWK